MSAAIVICVVWLGGVALLGVLATVIAPSFRVGKARRDLRNRVGSTVDASITALGRPVSGAVVVLAAWAAILASCWALGIGAHALQTSVDWPAFHWFEHRQVHDWSRAWRQITNMGGPRETQALSLVGAIALAIAWRLRGRRWWVPVLALVIGYAMEKYGQIVLQTVVHRGHPPTTRGTYPSGGCARVIVVYGQIILLSVRMLRPRDRRAWIAGCALTAFFVSIQAYARLYNLEHWMTDVIGGLIFGAMLLATMVGVVGVLDRDLDAAVMSDGLSLAPDHTSATPVPLK